MTAEILIPDVPVAQPTILVGGDEQEPHGTLMQETKAGQNGVSEAGEDDNSCQLPKYGTSWKYQLPEIPLEDHYADEPRPLRVSVIGAGISGLIAGVLLPAKVPAIDLTIFEKNADVGGTWFENVYPGVRCDVPAHVYQTSFEPNPDWSEQFAQGPEIRAYWTKIAQKYGVYKFLRLSHRVEELKWDDTKSVWLVKVHNLITGEVYTHNSDVVLTAIGRFNAWKLPKYEGMQDFKGLLRHTSNWDPAFDPASKRVAVIGNGASGIQLVANIQARVARLDHYARNKTWVSASFAGDATSIKPLPLPADVRATFGDPEDYLRYRKGLEEKYWRGFSGWLKGSAKNEKSRGELVGLMEARLAKKPELAKHLIPDFSPGCRRLTPGPGYLEAITEDNVEYIQTPIKRLTKTGIETTDGRHREVDAIFCATGANVDMIPPFGIVAHGKDLRDMWSKDGEGYGFPYNYMGVATSGFPNLMFIHGANGSGRAGTVPHNIEVQVSFLAKLLRKMGREGIRTMQPTKKAVDDFVQYADAFFRTTVLSEHCSSWYNGGQSGARIHGVFPGSAALASVVVRDPRWEDWEYEYLSGSGNSLVGYLGRGCTRMEGDAGFDITSYLVDPRELDLRGLHESWWSVP